MNVNDVIANRAHVISGGSLEDQQKAVHPNADVNQSQSSNDTFPTAMHIASYQKIVEETIPKVQVLRDVLDSKAASF